MNLYCITCKFPLRDTETTAGRCWSCVEIQIYGKLDEETSKQQRPVDPVEGGWQTKMNLELFSTTV